jgi:hypothetical protein
MIKRSGVIIVVGAAHLSLQPGFGQSPVAHHCIGRHVQDCRGFFDAQPAKEPQLDDAAFPLVESGERLERVVQRDEVLTGLVGHDERVVERHPDALAPALFRVFRPRVVDEDATHHTSGHGEEVRAVLPRNRFSVDQPEVGLVDERGCLQAMSHALSGHAASRDLAQFLMHQRDQLLAGSHIAFSPFEKERGDIGGAFRNPPILGLLAQMESAPSGVPFA